MIYRTLAFLLLPSAFPLAAGELPLISEQPWIGVYFGYERRSFQFSVPSDGVGRLRPMGTNKKPISDRYSIKLQPLIEEVLPDGRTISKIAPTDGWEAVTPASISTEKVTYRGTVDGDARFEVTFEFSGDELRAGGSVIDKGSLNQPRFALRVQIPNVYVYDRDDEKREEKAEKDRIDLLRTDGEKLKLDTLTPLDAESEEFNGPGISQARIDLAGFKGHRFDLDAGDGAAFEFWNRGEAELYRGFTLGWKPDAAKDPEGKARFLLKVR